MKLERTLNIRMERMSVEGELEREERAVPSILPSSWQRPWLPARA